jgi:uncharacterized protein (DUF1697 family)
MGHYVALLRAINVGGSGKLAMAELRQLGLELGLQQVQTYIQSGNLVFQSSQALENLKALLESALGEKLARPVQVLLRTVEELVEVLRHNPFPGARPDQVLVLFLDQPGDPQALQGLRTDQGEQFSLSGRHLYLHFPNGQGKSRLKIPFADRGTGRNLNTLVQLVRLAGSESPATGKNLQSGRSTEP